MRNAFIKILVLSIIILFASALFAEKVIEDSTDLQFEKNIKFSGEEGAPDMVCTGTGVRKKAIFKVYGAAIYVEPAGAKAVLAKYMPKDRPEDMEDFGEELAENDKFWNDFLEGDFHKVVVMRFVRDVGADSIVGAYNDGFAVNLKDKSEEAKKAVKDFIAFFKDEIKDGQDMTLRVAPDGTLLVDYAGKYRGSIKNKTVAVAILKNWFGKDPISDDIKEGSVVFLYDVIK